MDRFAMDFWWSPRPAFGDWPLLVFVFVGISHFCLFVSFSTKLSQQQNMPRSGSLSQDECRIAFALHCVRRWPQRSIARILSMGRTRGQVSSGSVSRAIKTRGVSSPTAPRRQRICARRQRRVNLVKRLAKTVRSINATIAPRGRPPADARIRAARLRTVVARRAPAHPTAASIMNKLAQDHSISVSKSTITRDLHAAGLRCFRRPKWPTTSAPDFERRLLWCRSLARQGISSANVVFSDEKIFCSNDFGSSTQWAEDRGDVLGRQRTRFPSARIHVWAAIGIDFRVLVVLHEYGNARDRWTLDSDEYRSRCLCKVLPFCKTRRKWYQQDGAGCHVSRKTKKHIADTGARLLEWPPKSPDLNPVEVLWSLLQSKAAEDHPMSVAELVKAVRKAWRRMPQATINAVVRDFDRKIRECIAANGSVVQ